MKKMEEIIVLDFGSQYNQLITRRIREMGVFSELVNYDISIEEISSRNVKGIIFSGGPNSVNDLNAFLCNDAIFELNIPILGICYGMQYITKYFNGKVTKSTFKEYGRNNITICDDCDLFSSTPNIQTVWMSHGDHVEIIPNDFIVVAKSDNNLVASIANYNKNIYGLQFHPEVNNSEYGFEILKNFVYKICKCTKSWSMENYIEEQVETIRKVVGNKKVLLGISGGVDSSVAAYLISKAIKSQLTCMFIDHGLLRKNEASIVMERFKKYGIDVVKIDASCKFLNRLKEVSDPEQKRKIIGNTFVEVFDEEAKKLGTFDFLAQGTLYTDIIESGTKTAQTIKSHHNVGGLPENMNFKLLEPLNKLFKDEVRMLAKALEMDDELINRQPFPGPGLAIRIIGNITDEKIKIVQDSDLILREEIKNANLEKEIWQYFTVLLDNKTVGVMGDERSYMHIIAIRAVTSIDGMTADWAKIPYDVLNKISTRIVNEVKNVNRVVLDITSKPPGTIEWE